MSERDLDRAELVRSRIANNAGPGELNRQSDLLPDVKCKVGRRNARAPVPSRTRVSDREGAMCQPQ